MTLRRLFRLAPWRRSAIETELDDELRFHLERRAAQFVAAGYSAEAAWNEAVRRFGTLVEAERRLKQTARRRETGMRFSDVIDTLASDARYVIRQLARSPGFTATVIVTLALGIGANATMFAVIDRLVFRPPVGVVHPEELRRFGITFRRGTDTYTNTSLSYADFRDVRDSLGHGSGFAAYAYPQDFALGRGANAQRVRGQLVGGPFFDLLGTKPQVGRFFSSEDVAEPVGQNVAVIGDGFWRREFAGHADVIGKTLALGTAKYTIIGVAPRHFAGTGTSAIDVWLPLTAAGPLRFRNAEDWEHARGTYWLGIVGRFPGDSASVVAASVRATNIVRVGRPADSLATASFNQILRRYTTKNDPDVRVARLLFWVSAFVLLIACANVINLMMARSVQRRQEIAVRLALGIDATRLFMLLMSESVILAIAGGVAALGVVHWGGALMRARFLAGQTAIPGSLVDARVLAFTLAATLVVVVLIGLAPIANLRRLELTGVLRSRSQGGGRRRSRLQPSLIVGQVALCMLLLVGTALFVMSLRKLSDLRLGMDTRQVLVARMNLSDAGRGSADIDAAYGEFARRIAAVPGVTSTSVALSLPFSSSFGSTVIVPGAATPRVHDGGPYYNAIDERYFETLGTRLLRGRGITAADRSTKSRVVVINASMAQFYFSGREPIGACVKIRSDTVPCSTVVGIVENARRQSLIEGVSLQFFIPLEMAAGPYADRVLFVRVRGDADAMIDPVRRAMQSAMPDLPYADVRPMQTLLDGDFRPWTLGSTMFSVFGLVGLMLAIVGLYGTLAYDVAQRSRELSVRAALGAGAGDIVRLVTRGGLGLVTCGVAIGWVAAMGGARWVSDLLYETSARDVGVYGAVGGALILVGVAATALPAWRATKVDLREAMAAE